MWMRRLIVVAVVLGTIPSFVHAQTFDVGPSFGYYRPFGRFDPADLYASDLPMTPNELAGLAWGLEAHVAGRAPWSVKGVFSTASSKLPVFVNPGFGGASQTEERVNIATLEAQYRLRSGADGSRWLVGAGPAMIQHRGEGYSRYGSPQSWGGAVGLEFEHDIAHHLQLCANLRGVAYRFNMNSSWDHLNSLSQHGLQFDGLATLGLRWHGSLPGSPRER